jgi:hypothetical protein
MKDESGASWVKHRNRPLESFSVSFPSVPSGNSAGAKNSPENNFKAAGGE